jgi:hypothetical protein
MNIRDDAVSTQSSNPAAALFEREWLTYRKMVDNNYTFHREAYGELHRVLADEVRQAFRFLDIACGDASMTVTALRGTRIHIIVGSISPRQHSSWRGERSPS